MFSIDQEEMQENLEPFENLKDKKQVVSFLPPQEDKSFILYGTKYQYTFLRLFYTFYERLYKAYEISNSFENTEKCNKLSETQKK